jgi:RND family efflux transporter MFP subunit
MTTFQEMAGSGAVRLAGVGLLALSLAACGASEATVPATPAAQAAPSPVAVSTMTAEERPLARVLELTGTLLADAQTDVAAETTGRVVTMMVERGQAVAAGQVLARLDTVDAENALAEAEAKLAQTRARLGLADGGQFDAAETPDVRQRRVTLDRLELDYKRYEELSREGVVSRQQYEERRAAYLEAKAQLDATVNQMRQLAQQLRAEQAQVALKREALADTAVRAPFAGLVAEKHVDVGAYVQPGAKVATVVRTNPLRVELTVPEAAAATVVPGQTVVFTVQTYADRRFEGTVKYVGPSVSREARTLVAEAVVPNREGVLKPGLFATAQLQLPGTRPSVLVPAKALRSDAEASYVYVAAGGRAERRYVQLGGEAEGLVEVLRGVQKGDRVVTTGADRLEDGVLVAEEGSAAGPVGPAASAAAESAPRVE